MSATNHTPNYNLPQFVGTDKPTWLTDVNGALSAIDTQMKANADSATSAGSTATTTSTNLGNIANLNTTDKTSAVNAINEVNTNLGAVSNVASSASGTASQANTTVNGLISYLTFTQFGAPTITTNGVTVTTNNLRYAVNADGTFGKIYGDLQIVRTTSASGGTITINTPFRPTSDIQINGMFFQQEDATKNLFQGSRTTIKTDGRIIIERVAGTYNLQYNMLFPACVYFMADFGD